MFLQHKRNDPQIYFLILEHVIGTWKMTLGLSLRFLKFAPNREAVMKNIAVFLQQQIG